MDSLYARFDARIGVCSDSRTLASGQIFFALRGPSFNGNLFAATALEQGASVVVVDELLDGLDANDSRVFLVDDTLKTLQDLARTHRRMWGKTVIGLTGSNGKTTAKELFAHVLQQQFTVLATRGNLNNHIGVPLTLLQLLPEHEVAVIEMGANHIGEIADLAAISEPNLGYVTNFGLAHLEGFGGPDGVVKGKSELYRYIESSNGTSLVYFNDSKQLEHCGGQIIRFGTHDQYTTNNDGQMAVQWNSTKAQSHLIGDFQDRALSAAVAIGMHFGLSDTQIAKGIESYVPNNNRGEWRTVGPYRVFMDAYNANPSSMEASLRNAAPRLNADSTLYVAGDLFELGSYAAEAHQNMVDLMQSLGIKHALLVGPLFAATVHPYQSVLTTQELCDHWMALKPHASHIWVKGSRGMSLEKAVAVLDHRA